MLVKYLKSGAALLAAILCAAPDARAQAAPRLPRVFVEETLAAPAAARVAAALGRSHPVTVGARLTASLSEDEDEIASRLSTLAAAGVPVWLAVPGPLDADRLPAWRAAIRALLDKQPAGVAILEVLLAEQPEALRRFVLQVAATEARAGGGGILVAAGSGDAGGALAPTFRAADAPYLDAVVLSAGDTAASDALLKALPAVRDLRRGRAADDPVAARVQIVRDTLSTIGTSSLATAWSGRPDHIVDAVKTLAPAADLLLHVVQPLDPGAVGLTITQGGRAVADAVAFRLLFDEETFATYFAYDAAAAAEPIDVALRTAIEGTPVLVDLTTSEKTRAAGYSRDESSSRSRVQVPLTGRPMLVNFSDGATVLVVDRTGVSAERRLSVEEIVARHRQYQARLDALVHNYRAAARMEQHFRPSLTDPGYDVVTDNQYFVDDTGVEWEEQSFSVNGSKWGSDRPPFPLLQPEKVLSLPLELRLDADYRYELTGTERVGTFDCYRVRFEPVQTGRALYRGTVWIDRRSFARIRVQAVQTQTSAPIVSNEEVLTYEPVADIDGFPLLLLAKLTARQIVLIAGRNLLLEKAAVFSDFHVNADDFLELRTTARRGERVMYRDTDRGVRYFVKDGESRVVSDRATASARAMAMGVLVDPSFAFPLPIFGINYLDFEFRGRPDTQFALLFGGVLAAGNLQRPKLGGTPFDLSLDFFGIAAPASDRLYTGSGERDAERLLTWPLSTGVNFGWQYTAFQKAQLQYQLRYDPFVRDRTTAESFVVPSSTITQGVGGAWEYKRGGYSIALNGTVFARAHWEPWGPADALEANPPRTYLKYAAHVSRDVFFNVFHKVHLNASYFGGDRLDRFSRYQFGLFDDTRIHGVPASGVRFDDLGMARGSYSLNIFEQYRLDLFAEQAWGVDREVDTSWQPLTGLGIAVNLRAPWNTILRADVGKSLLPARYREVGSTVFQVMLLKPLQ